MKKIYIIAFIMIAVAIGLLINAADDLSTYSTFSEAEKSEGRITITGQLSKDKEMSYDPEVDPNYFSFYIRDTDGEERKVVLLAAKPQEFERSEQLVLTGQMHGDEFIATDMLMKCPSKYNDEEIYVKTEKGEI